MAHTEHHEDPQSSPPQGERLRVARIGKPHGVRGEVTAQPFTDEPAERLAHGVTLIRVPGPETQDQGTTPLTVTSQRWNKSICLLGFQGVTDRTAAEALRGSVLYVEVSAEPEDQDEDGGWYSHELEAMTCVGVDGRNYGVVVELLTGEAQDLLVVKTPSGEEILVPFVEELVPEIDPEAHQITLDPPPGLFP